MTDPLLRARRVLLTMQAHWTDDKVVHGALDSHHQEALDYLATWNISPSQIDGRHDAPSFDTVERLIHTREILLRIQPGPLEHTQMIVALSWQAAVLELELLRANGPASGHHMPIIGTTLEPRTHASTAIVAGVPVVVLSAGLIASFYTIAKAAVLSWPSGRTEGAFSAHPAHLQVSLDDDPRPTDLMVGMVVNWLRYGRAVPDRQVLVDDRYVTPIAMLVSCAERFVLAHEYWHALVEPTLPASTDDIGRELQADEYAAQHTISTASRFEQLTPDISVQGCLLAMEINAIVDDLIQLVRPAEATRRAATRSHPPFEARARRLLDHYDEAIVRTGRVATHVSVAAAAAVAASEIWKRARPNIETLFHNGVSIHTAWGQ